MRITSKGQVTIPIEIREKAGLLPHMEVEFVIQGEQVVIRKSALPYKGRGKQIVDRLRQAKPDLTMTTDEIMALFRGEP